MKRMLLALMSWSIAIASVDGALAEAPPEQAAPEAPEAENPAYKQAVDAGIEEYGLGHYEEARTLFQRAHAIDPNARTLRGLGMVEFELRHYVRAAQLLEASLASKRKPLTVDQRAAVDELLARSWQFIGRYTVAVQPETAVVQFELDSPPVQLDSERRLTLEAGEHVLRVSAPERLTRELRLDVKGGEQQILQIELQAKPEAAPIKSSQIPGRGERPVLGIVLASAGSGVAAAGASLGVVALLAARDVELQGSDEAHRAHNFALAADVALGLGIATAVSGAVLLLLKRKSRREQQHSRLRLEFPAIRVRF